MSERTTFIVKAKSSHGDKFRAAFSQMKAVYEEKIESTDRNVIIFTVHCNLESVHILQDTVPISAYASIGYMGRLR
jgi:hypothetical protein